MGHLKKKSSKILIFLSFLAVNPFSRPPTTFLNLSNLDAFFDLGAFFGRKPFFGKRFNTAHSGSRQVRGAGQTGHGHEY